MKKSVGVAVFAVILTVVLLVFWPFLQRMVGSTIPAAIYAMTREVARLGLYVAIGVMLQGIVPNMNRWRIGLYLAGTSAFLVNLLGENNSGNVFLESGLTMQMAWSVIGNWRRHEPMSRDWRKWMRGLLVLVICYGIGLLAVSVWPIDASSQFSGWWWPVIGIIGGVNLFIEVNLLETGVLRGDTPLYIAIHCLSCGLLTLSYLGQYNEAGLTLNVALVSVALYSFIKATRLKKEKKAKPAMAMA